MRLRQDVPQTLGMVGEVESFGRSIYPARDVSNLGFVHSVREMRLETF